MFFSFSSLYQFPKLTYVCPQPTQQEALPMQVTE